MSQTTTPSGARHLTDEQVWTLNERHGWFQYRDAQSDVSRQFAHDAIELYLQSKPDLAALIARNAELEAERDEADRRAGAAERRLAYELDASSKRAQWLSEAKHAAGYKDAASFDDVWAEALAAMKVVRGAPTDCDSGVLLKPREIWACCHGHRREGHRSGVALYCGSQEEAEREARDSDFPRTAVLFREVFVPEDFIEAGDIKSIDDARTAAGEVGNG